MKNRLSNVHLHPTVSNPELLADLMQATGLVAVPSSRTRGIILVDPEDAAIREALVTALADSEPVGNE